MSACRLPGECLPSLADDIAIDRIQFDAVCRPAGLFRRHECRPGAHERVQDDLRGVRTGAVANHPRDQGDGLHRRVQGIFCRAILAQDRLRLYRSHLFQESYEVLFFHFVEVEIIVDHGCFCEVLRKIMARPLVPAIEDRLVFPVVIVPRQHGAAFYPHQGLADVDTGPVRAPRNSAVLMSAWAT